MESVWEEWWKVLSLNFKVVFSYFFPTFSLLQSLSGVLWNRHLLLQWLGKLTSCAWQESPDLVSRMLISPKLCLISSEQIGLL